MSRARIEEREERESELKRLLKNATPKQRMFVAKMREALSGCYLHYR